MSYITVKELSDIAGCHPFTVKRAVKAGKLVPNKVESNRVYRLVFDRDPAVKWATDHKAKWDAAA